MNYFIIKPDDSGRFTGTIDGSHEWCLPGVICPACRATWSDGIRSYASVDLTPVKTLADFETPRAEPIEEYERLCALLRPLLPEGAQLNPGTALGPFSGRYQGRFGHLVAPDPWWLWVRRETLETLHAAGLQLTGCRAHLRSHQGGLPELLELELHPHGRLHPDCLPVPRAVPCRCCGRTGLSLPDELVLDEGTLPAHLDMFRLEDFSSVIVCTNRFFTVYQDLGLTGVFFQPLPTRMSP
ncbi:MAG: double-CXXCG motif protein [Cystobacter sp.]